jgi:parallel beta-helix repeat protein
MKRLHRIARLVLLLLGIAIVFMASFKDVSADPISVTFTPSADSYVASDNAGANYGISTQIRTDGSPIVRSLIKFNVQGLGGGVSSVTLRIYANSNHTAGFSAHSADNGWQETVVTYNNQPTFDPSILGSSGTLSSGTWSETDVTGLVTGNGEVTVLLDTASSTAMSLGSRESAFDPELVVVYENSPTPTPSFTPTPTPTEISTPSPTPTLTPTPTPTPTATPTPPVSSLYIVSGSGASYSANSDTFADYSGTLKFVIESAVAMLQGTGGGTVRFEAGLFDLGGDWLIIKEKSDIVFEGAGIDITYLQNSTSVAKDTEPFSFTRSNRMTIKDMTVVAGGSMRSTSDAIDFDDGSDNLVERVKITASRARGIVFDGKDSGASAERNVVRDSIITGIYTDGIELLASSDNQILNNQIYNVGGHGIQLTKSSTSAPQANKQSSGNTISGNIVDNSGMDGIDLNSGNSNTISGNLVTNSSDKVSSRDGIRILSSDGISCSLNLVSGNTATDNQVTKTQSYGLNITSSNCVGNVVTGNTFAGNKNGEIRDLGTGTLYP